MRILILNVDYPGFLRSMYERNPGLETSSYADQMRARNESLFGVADFYSRNLASLGHHAWDLHINNEILQQVWAADHGLVSPSSTPGRREHRSVLAQVRKIGAGRIPQRLKPWLSPLTQRLSGQRALLTILAEQIRHYKPEVILNQAVEWIPDEFLLEFKDDVRLIVGQVASPLTATKRLKSYDLLISSLPNFVDRFRRQGLHAELVKLAFEPSVLETLSQSKTVTDVSFVGTLSGDHQERLKLLEWVAERVDLRVWGRLDSTLPAASALRGRHSGPAWGREMYEILQQSRITLNYHIGVAGQYANNLRLYEATGVGTLLLTDAKENLHEMFAPGSEVAVYRNAEECVELAQHFLDHESERKSIADRGQRRTLRDHTYAIRMQELSALFERAISGHLAASPKYV